MATTRKEAHKAEPTAEAAKPVGGEVDSDEAPEAPVEETKKVFFSIVDRPALRRGDFTSVTDLTAAIGWSCRSWNEHCSPLPGPSPPTKSSPSCTVKPPQRRSTSGPSVLN